ncbi:hypothetical protein l13_16540 [Neisseria weaveri ATCC 51223]|nr:hypothetical protein l13_16540 [Neisseria weaveri ATCC 51223]
MYANRRAALNKLCGVGRILCMQHIKPYAALSGYGLFYGVWPVRSAGGG